MTKITTLTEGMQIIHNGNQLYTVTKELSNTFQEDDTLIFIPSLDDPIHIPKFAIDLVQKEILAAQQGFYELAAASDEQLNTFFETFSKNLANNSIWENIQSINNIDVEKAKQNKKSTTRLEANDKCRNAMIEGLQQFQNQPIKRLSTLKNISHETWTVELVKNPLGIIGFVFEGRPNVIADATGVLKSGNTVVFRVGQDALKTAKAIMDLALYPALDQANISRNCIRLLDHPARATAWALFANKTLNLAVARGSGHATRILGNIAHQHGVPVSLHGTGGAWMMTTESTNPHRLHDAIIGSLDRKVCNTLNTICILKSQYKTLLPITLTALEKAGKHLNESYKVHIESESIPYLPNTKLTHLIPVSRANGIQHENQFEPINKTELGIEWEWEKTPEITLIIVESLEEAITLYNTYSPQFVASLITENPIELTHFFNAINAPFVGNGMTRWVDGQYALLAPELGLSNWENGRLLARSAILSGDSIYTTRLKMTQKQSDLKR
ncbi:glutamate-5-semialdehyde dehydrogenase [Candidatus Marinamargulisbacteria bacterium SCGC AG-333-B06]|nr:glutamate-5-semialdehyde dehydrogenase [Candidatus Marinamargulisbacteria bacterium SCGC AG-333-B06]